MNKNIFMFLSVSLVLLIPVPGRFAYGLVLIFELISMMIAGTLFRALVYKIKMVEYQKVLISVVMVAFAVLFKQVLTIISPVMAFTLGYLVYLPAVSAFLLGTLYEVKENSLADDIKKNFGTTISISVPLIIAFFVRDLLGYGTITLPSGSGIFALHVISGLDGKFPAAVFFASIPGAFVVLALCVVLINIFGLKIDSNKQKSVEEVADENKNTENLQSPVDSSVPGVSENFSAPTSDFSGLSDTSNFPNGPSLLNIEGLMGDNNVE